MIGGLLHAILGDSTAEVRLNSPVASVDQTGERVTVTLRDRSTVLADAVIVAVAYNAWGTIEFDPPLNDASREMRGYPRASRSALAGVRAQITL